MIKWHFREQTEDNWMAGWTICYVVRDGLVT